MLGRDEQQSQSPEGGTPTTYVNRGAKDAQREASGTTELATAEVHAGGAEPWSAARIDATVTLIGAETTFDNAPGSPL